MSNLADITQKFLLPFALLLIVTMLCISLWIFIKTVKRKGSFWAAYSAVDEKYPIPPKHRHFVNTIDQIYSRQSEIKVEVLRNVSLLREVRQAIKGDLTSLDDHATATLREQVDELSEGMEHIQEELGKETNVIQLPATVRRQSR